MDHSGDTLLVVQSHRGKLCCQIDDPWKCIVAKETNGIQWRPFKLRKLRLFNWSGTGARREYGDTCCNSRFRVHTALRIANTASGGCVSV
jgi:hypothetical protein